MTAIAPYRSQIPVARAGFAQLLHAEWTKFRTVRGWVLGMLLVPLVTVGFGVFTGSNSQCGYEYPGANGQMVSGPCSAPVGPGGELVKDQFYFVHQPLAGNGSITVRVTSLTSGDLQPWAKAGIIIKANTVPGSAYAAMMVTGAHGVRMQWDFTQDTAGLTGAVSAASPRWLRLVRSGDTITGYDSADGVRWSEVGAVALAGLPSTAQLGLLATTPPPNAQHQSVQQIVTATGTFDHVGVTGAAGGTWRGTDVGTLPGPAQAGTPDGFQQNGSGFTVTGNGDIAPDAGEGSGTGTPISHTLDGVFPGLIAAIVVAVIFITAEYRRGLIRITLTASPGRGRVLAAKAVVVGAITFVAAFIGCAIAVPVTSHVLRANGNVIFPISALTWLRVVAGTAAVFAATAVFAVALGSIFRRGSAAVSTAFVVLVLPWFLAVSSPVLSATAADWLLRLSPSAALAIQQTTPEYPQVASSYLPHDGFFPLAPWAGFAVLCAWIAAALGLAVYLMRRRDV
jgi:ABC-type transport system involved in multi-copper enzyme maturation permease subunit